MKNINIHRMIGQWRTFKCDVKQRWLWEFHESSIYWWLRMYMLKSDIYSMHFMADWFCRSSTKDTWAHIHNTYSLLCRHIISISLGKLQSARLVLLLMPMSCSYGIYHNNYHYYYYEHQHYIICRLHRHNAISNSVAGASLALSLSFTSFIFHFDILHIIRMI